MNISNMISHNGIKLKLIGWSILKRFTQPSDSVYVIRHVPDIDIISINYNHYDYRNDNMIKYLYNNNKIKYYDFS